MNSKVHFDELNDLIYKKLKDYKFKNISLRRLFKTTVNK